ncbi:hypothetical protein ACS0TY_007638 [Phlomoides rotata]
MQRKRQLRKWRRGQFEEGVIGNEIAKRELALIEKQEIEARNMRGYIDQLESRASEALFQRKEFHVKPSEKDCVNPQ